MGALHRTSFERVLAIGALFLLPACGKTEIDVGLTNLAGPPGSSLQGDQLKLRAGTALIVEAHPMDGDEPATTTVDIVASPPFEVLRTSTKNRFVIVAQSPGHATIRVVAEGRDARTLTADAL